MDDAVGEVIRSPYEELKFKFCEAYKNWIEASEVYYRHLGGRTYYESRYSFYQLEVFWNEYVAIRDVWVGFKVG